MERGLGANIDPILNLKFIEFLDESTMRNN